MNLTEPSLKPTLTPPGWLLVAVMAAPIPPQLVSEIPKAPVPMHERIGRNEVGVHVVADRVVVAQEPLGTEGVVGHGDRPRG